MPPFFMAVSMLASPKATPTIAVAFASPTFEEPVAVPTATGPLTSVYKLPLIGVTPAQPVKEAAASTPTNSVASTLVIFMPPFQFGCGCRIARRAIVVGLAQKSRSAGGEEPGDSSQHFRDPRIEWADERRIA